MSESSLSLRRRGGRAARDPGGAKGPAARARSDDKRRRAGDKRGRILDAAVKVFARSGFHATRVSEVAKAAGVADGTIYLYFASKEELLVSLFEDRVDKLLSFMREELPKKPDAPSRLRAAGAFEKLPGRGKAAADHEALEADGQA